MKTFSRLTVLALIGTSYAWPTFRLWQFAKRQTLSDLNDVDILRYALTLEHLEDKFYREGLANFSQSAFAQAGFDQTFYNNLKEISADETTHVNFLTAGLKAAGVTPTLECTYAFGVTSVAQFVGLANVLEGVGVSAYLGAARQIMNKDYLTAAGSILTIEARHNAYLRASLAKSPFAKPFDDPLTPDEVYTLAHGFIVSCPTNNPTFPVKPFPGLAVTTTGTIASGQTISVSTSGYVLHPADSAAKLYAAFITSAGPQWSVFSGGQDGVNFQVTVPQGVNGQSYLLLCNCNTTVTDDTIVAGPTIVEITNPYPETVTLTS